MNIFFRSFIRARSIAQLMGGAPNTAPATQVLIGTLATALGAALSSNNVRIYSLHHNPLLTSSSPDIGCDLHPPRCVGSRCVQPGSHMQLKRTPRIASSSESSQSLPA